MSNSPVFNKNSRRADPANVNRVMTVGFGHGSADRGTKVQQLEHRCRS